MVVVEPDAHQEGSHRLPRLPTATATNINITCRLVMSACVGTTTTLPIMRTRYTVSSAYYYCCSHSLTNTTTAKLLTVCEDSDLRFEITTC